MALPVMARTWHLTKNSSANSISSSPQRRVASNYLNYVHSSDDEILELLNSDDFEVRLRVLNRLRNMSQANRSWFRNFHRKADLFKAFGAVLSDSNWEVQHQCIKFLADTIDHYNEDLEWCMISILPCLVPKLGSSKITVRRVTVQTLSSFLKNTDSVQPLQHAIVTEALRGDQNSVQEALHELPNLYLPSLSDRNWGVLVDGLTRMLDKSDTATTDLVLSALEKLQDLVGTYEFNQLIQNLPESQKNSYEVLQIKRSRTRMSSKFGSHRSLPANTSPLERNGKQYRCGIIPVSIWDQVQNETEPKVRVAALEQLKGIVENLDAGDTKQLSPHLVTYFNMISNVLDDLNFKVVVLTLEIMRISVASLQKAVEPHLQHIVNAMSKHLGNQKTVIKQINMMTCVDLMQHLHPQTVIAVLSANLQHRNSRVREEVICIYTAALLKFPSDDFNLTAIAHALSPLLADPKRRVRLAAFELLTILAQTLGPGKLEPLLKCVREVEHKQNVPGLMIAVQARLARHQLPRIRYDGLIEYSVPHSPDGKPPYDPGNMADYDWIMSAAVGPGSAVSRSLSPSKLGPATQPLPPAPLTRTPSIPEHRENSMPWEEKEESHSAPASAEVATPYGARLAQINDQEHSHPAFKVQDYSHKSKIAVMRKSHSHNNFPEQGAPRGHLEPLSHRERGHRDHRRRSSEADELATSLDRVRFNAVKKRQEFDRNHVNKSQSADALAHNWDDTPIRPSKNVPNGYNSHHRPSKHFSPRKRSLDREKINYKSNFSSATSTDTRETVLSEPPGGGRPPPFVARKIPVKKPPAPPPNKAPPKPPPPAASSNPSQALQLALKKTGSDDWQVKVDGITAIQRLSSSNTNVVAADLHTVVTALNNEAKNLRSSVSKQAIICLGSFFLELKKQMDPEVDKTAAVLMQKTGDVSSAFIREDALQALEFMVDSVTPSKSLNALINSGANTKSIQIRSACAQLITRLVENMGASKLLSQKDLSDRTLPQLLAFATDAHPQCRHHGKAGLAVLHRDKGAFDKACSKALNDRQSKTVKELIDKGAGENGQASASNIVARNGSVKRKAPPNAKLPEHMLDSMDLVKTDLASTAWEQRLKGVNGFEALCKSHSKAVASDLKLVDNYVARINDINGKVALQALQTHLSMMPQMGAHFSTETLLKTAIIDMVKGLMAHLPSKNMEMCRLAQSGLDACVKYIDNGVLIISFAMATRGGNFKQKPDMLPRLSRMCSNIYRSKPKLVEMHALPILWDLVKTQLGDSAMKLEANNYARSLARTMGKQNLLSQANGLTPAQKQHLEEMMG